MNECLHVFKALNYAHMDLCQSGQRPRQLWASRLMNTLIFPCTDRQISQIRTCPDFIPSTWTGYGECPFLSFLILFYPLNVNAYHTPFYSVFQQAISTHTCL